MIDVTKAINMPNEFHLALLLENVETWDSWRARNPKIKPDLRNADLSHADLGYANLNGADLRSANLSHADLGFADLSYADLSGANLNDAKVRRASLSNANLRDASLRRTRLSMAVLSQANLRCAKLQGAKLAGADLFGADLSHAVLSFANVRGAQFINASLHKANLGDADMRFTNLHFADLSGARLRETVLGDVDLTETRGLDSCHHTAPSSVDYRTLARSRDVPLSFWRGCGLPDLLIDQLPALVSDVIQFYSCFLSYSSKDQEFADHLHADLQSNGVRCWFAPHDLPIGAKTWDGIDEAIRTRDKVLLILSEGAIESDWVEDEVTKAFAEERTRKELVLFPVRIDDVAMETGEPWARKLRDNRNIGDFTQWKDGHAYKTAFERLLRDLEVER